MTQEHSRPKVHQKEVSTKSDVAGLIRTANVQDKAVLRQIDANFSAIASLSDVEMVKHGRPTPGLPGQYKAEGDHATISSEDLGALASIDGNAEDLSDRDFELLQTRNNGLGGALGNVGRQL